MAWLSALVDTWVCKTLSGNIIYVTLLHMSQCAPSQVRSNLEWSEYTYCTIHTGFVFRQWVEPLKPDEKSWGTWENVTTFDIDSLLWLTFIYLFYPKTFGFNHQMGRSRFPLWALVENTELSCGGSQSLMVKVLDQKPEAPWIKPHHCQYATFRSLSKVHNPRLLKACLAKLLWIIVSCKCCTIIWTPKCINRKCCMVDFWG